MTVDFSEVEALRAKEKAERPKPGTPNPAGIAAYLARLDRIAGQLADLTSSDGWAIHRLHLTGHRDVVQADLAAVTSALIRGPEAGDALVTLKLRAAYLQGQVDAFTAAMSDAQEIIDINTKVNGGPPSPS